MNSLSRKNIPALRYSEKPDPARSRVVTPLLLCRLFRSINSFTARTLLDFHQRRALIPPGFRRSGTFCDYTSLTHAARGGLYAIFPFSPHAEIQLRRDDAITIYNAGMFVSPRASQTRCILLVVHVRSSCLMYDYTGTSRRSLHVGTHNFLLKQLRNYISAENFRKVKVGSEVTPAETC